MLVSIIYIRKKIEKLLESLGCNLIKLVQNRVLHTHCFVNEYVCSENNIA